MAKTSDPSQFPQPPKPTFAVEIVHPSTPTIGNDWKSEAPDFKSAFLKFMQEAGELLGKAAASEIEKVKLKIDVGQATGSSSTTGLNPKTQTPSEMFALRQFLNAARLPGMAHGVGMG